GKGIPQIAPESHHAGALRLLHHYVVPEKSQPAIGVAYWDAVHVRPGVVLARVIANRLAEQVVLVVHENGGRLEPGGAVGFGPKSQLGDAVELVFFRRVSTDSLDLRPDPPFIVRYVELPILELPWQPRTYRPVDIAPVIVEERKGEALSFPEEDI